MRLTDKDVRLETEALVILTKRMKLIKDEVLLSNAINGTISKSLRKKAFKIMTLYDNFEKDLKIK
jgi:hypothetical protein